MPNSLFRTLFLTCIVLTSAQLGLVPAAGAAGHGQFGGGSIDSSTASPSTAASHLRFGPPVPIHRTDPVDDVASAVSATAGRFDSTTLQAPGATQRSHAETGPLDNEVRRTVYEAVRESPGTYLAEIAEETDVSWSTVRYHGRVLEDHGLVTREKVHGRHRLYPAGTADPKLTAALGERASSTVLVGLSRLEPVGVSALAADLDVSPSTVTYHLQRLEEDGLVERERDGRRVVARLEPPVRQALAGEGLIEEIAD